MGKGGYVTQVTAQKPHTLYLLFIKLDAMTTTVVIGGNFAGMTAALEIKSKGKKDHRVLVVDKSPLFLFIPSLIWVPFGRREVKDISFRKDEILKKKGVEFIQTEALSVDPENNTVITKKGDFTYDHLVIATGPKVDYGVAPGVKEHAHYIGTPRGHEDQKGLGGL